MITASSYTGLKETDKVNLEHIVSVLKRHYSPDKMSIAFTRPTYEHVDINVTGKSDGLVILEHQPHVIVTAKNMSNTSPPTGKITFKYLGTEFALNYTGESGF